MHYLFIGYTGNILGQTISGNTGLAVKNFPNQEEIKECCKISIKKSKKAELTNCTIISISELDKEKYYILFPEK